ncbi:concanavalin A-like lectin/glucanase domain-containing protein [Lipomyces kononenkoae]|uniref:Concanavalin A-like lectin/glucanase domain-containing protein n=1 Tax=Lipomyces kononenkoae TaxID=34357 RepID=A0ACC3SW67_LIPKO
MLRSVSSRVAVALVALAVLPNALATITCGEGSLCPQSAPCCSQYGECGIGAYCLGGCNPKFSFNVDSCAPQPICVNGKYTFPNLNSVELNTKYLGDSSQAAFVSSGYAYPANGDLLLAMPNQTTGTVVASSTYVWYGKVDVVMKSSRGQGVVTAFILFSDVQDEIDYEFVGADLGTVQTNYYYQGILDWHNSQNISLSDTFANWHTYSVDWHEDYIQWSVDGQVGRTLFKNATYNATSGEYDYPQTPSRVQLSIWPGGLASNAPGTIAWAGGLIDWDSADIQQYGYDYAIVQSVNVECYAPPSFATQSGGKSYRYVNQNGTQESVIITNDDTVLASFDDSGLDMSSGASSSTSSSASSSASKSATSTASIPNVSVVSSSGASTSTSSALTSSIPTVPGGNGGPELQRGDSSSGTTSSQSIADASMVSQSTSTTSSSSSSGAITTSVTGTGVGNLSTSSSFTSAASTSSAGTGFSQGGSTSHSAGAVVSPTSGALVLLVAVIFGLLMV